MKDVSGKIAFVTGAGGELGRSLALGLANLGVIVVIWDINQKGRLRYRKDDESNKSCWWYLLRLFAIFAIARTFIKRQLYLGRKLER
ncbi:estradiol 17-beta-dehydrogenase 11-like isoform X1 [Vespula maculifrons]|uniref:Estradiol 17-beta-dehydrogenase 11-like isoform X1 n=1 Tax=Vespula maculifrons TaxID=7453 RepID=A0ABD2C250_VESMC